MTTRSRPMTDYKRTSLMMEYIKQYEELSDALLEMLEELKNSTLEDDELDKLNIALEDMAREMEELVQLIAQHGGDV